MRLITQYQCCHVNWLIHRDSAYRDTCTWEREGMIEGVHGEGRDGRGMFDCTRGTVNVQIVSSDYSDGMMLWDTSGRSRATHYFLLCLWLCVHGCTLFNPQIMKCNEGLLCLDFISDLYDTELKLFINL